MNVATGLTLTPDYATQKVAILAATGAGKSNAAVVLAEELYDEGIPWVAIDPKGDWWGIRSAGEKPGLPVVVFGGTHGDVPLEPTSGKLIARLIAEQRVTCVLDVSDFDTRAQMFRFLADFASTLLRVNEEPLHVFCEEADDYLPQRTGGEGGDLARCLGAWQRLIKRGRSKGIGATMISQRSASLNKDALNQAQTLIAMRVTAPRDRKAIQEWVEAEGGQREIVDSLPGLDNGEAWVWSPQWLRVTQRVRFRRRATFDSGGTPVMGQSRRPSTLADVDLDAIKAEMAETIERAKADDPALLRAEISSLRRDLRTAQTQSTVITETIEVPVVPEAAMTLLASIEAALTRLANGAQANAEGMAPVIELIRGHAPGRPATPMKPALTTAAAPRPIAPSAEPSPYRAGARRLLEAVASWPDGCTKAQAAVIAGLKRTSGTFQTYLGELRRDGMIEVNGQHLRVTEAGAATAGIEAVPQDRRAVLDYWRGRFRAGARRMLEAIERSPGGLSRQELGQLAGLDPSSGTFGTYLGELRRAELITTDGSSVRLADWLAG